MHHHHSQVRCSVWKKEKNNRMSEENSPRHSFLRKLKKLRKLLKREFFHLEKIKRTTCHHMRSSATTPFSTLKKDPVFLQKVQYGHATERKKERFATQPSKSIKIWRSLKELNMKNGALKIHLLKFIFKFLFHRCIIL